jgi:hypothetical protein
MYYTTKEDLGPIPAGELVTVTGFMENGETIIVHFDSTTLQDTTHRLSEGLYAPEKLTMIDIPGPLWDKLTGGITKDSLVEHDDDLYYIYGIMPTNFSLPKLDAHRLNKTLVRWEDPVVLDPSECKPVDRKALDEETGLLVDLANFLGLPSDGH